MQKYFDLNRFAQVLRLTWRTQNRLPYYLLLATLFLSLVILAKFANDGLAAIHAEAPVGILALGFAILSFIYAGLSFSEMEKKSPFTQFIQTPATATEKWLAKFVLAFLAFPVLVLLAFELVFWLFNLVSPAVFTLRFQPIPWAAPLKAFFLLFFMAMPLAFSSGVFWKKFGFIKTLVCILALIAFWAFFTNTAPINSVDFRHVFSVLTPPFFPDHSNEKMALYNSLFWGLGVYLPSFLLLLSSFFLIKEREV